MTPVFYVYMDTFVRRGRKPQLAQTAEHGPRAKPRSERASAGRDQIDFHACTSGSAPTCTVARAGGASPKYAA